MNYKNIFLKDQKGSSAMPHKKNPILSENLTGLARMVRSAVNARPRKYSSYGMKEIFLIQVLKEILDQMQI